MAEEEDNERKLKSSQVEEAKYMDNTPWLQQVGWLKLFKGRDMNELVELARFPGLEPMCQVSLHEIWKPESKHHKLPWPKRLENTEESSTNPVPSTSQPVEEDIYGQPPCKDGIYMSKWI
jgi:hypothetical protein